MDVGRRSKSKAWSNEFLFVRGMIGGPDASPLYQYHVTDEEYSELPTILRQSIPDIESPSYSGYWSAVFCLFVAEKYRREYDGSNLGWSWSGFEKPLSIELPSRLHSEIVKKGLEFWGRPIRLRTNGYDYLGSLFDEGGLPWRLVQSETHGFGRAVRGAVNQYYRVKQAGGDVASVIENYGYSFPQTFRTPEKYLLIASIVEWLMQLAETHPISSVDEPADYLDEHAPDWRKKSPLPLSEHNARNLINDWLKDAGRSRSEKKRLEADEKNYTCEHWLQGSFANWSINTEVFLPERIEIQLEGHRIQSTRLEIAFYEGDLLLKRSGIAHGKVNDDRSAISVKIQSRSVTVNRANPELPLTIQFLSNGHRIHASYFEGSEVEYRSSPMVFVHDSEQLRLLSTASVVVPSDKAIIRIPPGIHLETEITHEELAFEQEGAQWIGVSSDLVLAGEHTRVLVRFDPKANFQKPTLVGTVSLYSTLPNLVYRGWPSVSGLDSDQHNDIRILANGAPLLFDYQQNQVGSFALSVLGDSGETLLRRRVGVIPKDLRVVSVPASRNSPARIMLKSSRRLTLQVLDYALNVEVQDSEDGYGITMEPKAGQCAPEKISIALTDGVKSSDPVVLRLPYPKTGVQLFDDEGNEIKSGLISLDQLIETSMTLTPRPDSREQFFVCLELISQDVPNFRRYYPFTVNKQSQQISLYAFEEDIQQMLGTAINQDAFVRIRIETDQMLKQIDVVRYNARLEGPNSIGRLEVVADRSVPAGNFPGVSGMRLDDPQAEPVAVIERMSEGVGMGVFEIPMKMMKNGPWLLFPPAESKVKFRPTVWVAENSLETNESSPQTLHAAAKLFHPKHNPHVFDGVIATMAEDLSHSGWDYLRTLKDRFSTLPLSAFEAWKSLAANSAAMAVAVFRLEFDPDFCRRMSNELAVIWETVDVHTWVYVRRSQKKLLVEKGLPEEFAEKVVQDRIKSVSESIPCFAHLAEYLKEPEHQNLQQVPYVFAKYCFEDLRRNHADDQRWPEWFKVELTNWIHQQDFPDELKRLPDVGFSRAVAYLPIFMAAVTAGKARFEDLTPSLPELKLGARVLSDFDRYGWYEPTYSLVLSNLLLQTE